MAFCEENHFLTREPSCVILPFSRLFCCFNQEELITTYQLGKKNEIERIIGVLVGHIQHFVPLNLILHLSDFIEAIPRFLYMIFVFLTRFSCATQFCVFLVCVYLFLLFFSSV